MMVRCEKCGDVLELSERGEEFARAKLTMTCDRPDCDGKLEQVVGCVPWQTCPVCQGTGKVGFPPGQPGQPSEDGTRLLFTGNQASYPCERCHELGTIPMALLEGRMEVVARKCGICASFKANCFCTATEHQVKPDDNGCLKFELIKTLVVKIKQFEEESNEPNTPAN
jgi:hypothetical protein